VRSVCTNTVSIVAVGANAHFPRSSRSQSASPSPVSYVRSSGVASAAVTPSTPASVCGTWTRPRPTAGVAHVSASFDTDHLTSPDSVSYLATPVGVAVTTRPRSVSGIAVGRALRSVRQRLLGSFGISAFGWWPLWALFPPTCVHAPARFVSAVGRSRKPLQPAISDSEQANTARRLEGIEGNGGRDGRLFFPFLPS